MKQKRTTLQQYLFLVFLSSLPATFLSGNNLPQWTDLFNGHDLSGWVDVNTSPRDMVGRGWLVEMFRKAHRSDEERKAI